MILPDRSTVAVLLDDSFYPDCGCWVDHHLACPVGTNSNDCHRFELLIHCRPHVNCSGTAFSYTRNCIEETVWMCKW